MVVKDRNNPLKPGGYHMYHHISDANPYILPTHYVYCFMWLSVQREIIFQCSIQKVAGFQPCDSVCSVRGLTWLFSIFQVNP